MIDLAATRLETVAKILLDSSPVVVAFSGGVDSTLVLKLALETLGPENVLAVTGISPSISSSEQSAAESLAKRLGASFLAIETHEIENENYRSNPVNRCFFCKEELYTKLQTLANERHYKTILDGTNADDAHDVRPGLKAARQLGVRSPLLEAGIGKEDVRKLAKRYGLPNWDKPATPCLSSRVPYGEPITIERLDRIQAAEQIVRDAGFKQVRVRDHFPTARIEIVPSEFSRLIEEPGRSRLVEQLKALGYRFVTLDLAGFKSGSFNVLGTVPEGQSPTDI